MKTTSRVGNAYKEMGSYSNHDNVILNVDEDVAKELSVTIQNELYKLRFGFWANVNGFRVCFSTDEVLPLYHAKVYLRKHKIPYERIFIKASLNEYVSNT